jgi:predicted DNA-binding protein
MVNLANRSRYFLDIDPELRKRVKAEAALQGKTMKTWLTEAIIARLEDDIDAREGLAALKDKEGVITFEEYMKSRGEA